jgi:hypothetical protein
MTGVQSSFILHPTDEEELMVCRGAIQMSQSVEDSVTNHLKSQASNAPELWTLGTR